MRTVQIELYKFDELSEEAKERAIEQERNNIYEYGLQHVTDMLNESFKEELKELSIIDVALTWDCSYSQGDCFNISGKVDTYNIDNFLTKIGLEQYADLSKHIYRISIKENTVYLEQDIDINSDDEIGEIIEEKISAKLYELEEEIQERITELARDLHKRAYEAYEYETSNDNIIDSLKINEVEFTENGERY